MSQNNITDIKQFKTGKKVKKAKEELKQVIYLYTLMMKALSPFRHYHSAMDVIAVLNTNKVLCEIYLNKLEKYKDDSVEKIKK